MAKVFKTLKKKAQATPIVGVILDSLKSENPRQNAPSIQAVLDNLQPKQSLINPDFQINQRGQSSYVQNKDELKLTVDCWIMASSSWEKTILTPLKDGVRIQSITLDEGGASYSNSFTQILENEPEGDKTIIINVTNLTGHAKFGVLDKKDSGVILDKKELVKGINVFHFNISEEKNLIIRYFIDKNTDISIKYIDLFEGDIAYPHVKEDKAIALLRCQRKVRKYDILCFVINYSYTAGRYMACCNIEKMDDIPTFVHGQVLYYNTSGSMENGTVESKKTYTSYLSITAININNMNSGSNVLFLNNVLLSCEPL